MLQNSKWNTVIQKWMKLKITYWGYGKFSIVAFNTSICRKKKHSLPVILLFISPFVLTIIARFLAGQRCTNADLKISLYSEVHIKTISWKLRILKPKNSWVIYPWSLHFSQKVDYFLIYSIVSVCLQTNITYMSWVHKSQKVNIVIMWNLRHIIFMWRRRYWQIFISTLVCL